MKYLFFVILAATIGLSGKVDNESAIEYSASNMAAAKTLASMQGKLLLVDFNATWCLPCRLMEENTFKNKVVDDYLNRHYIVVKVDVDDFDGLMLKDKFKVSQLPTLLVFSSQGMLLERMERTYAPTEFLEIIGKYNQPVNRVKAPLKRPALKPVEVEAPVVEASNEEIPVEIPVDIVIPEEVHTVSTPESVDFYGIQFGVFSNNDSAHSLQKQLKEDEQVSSTIYAESREAGLIYKVVADGFGSYEMAKIEQQRLSEAGFDSFVKKIYTRSRVVLEN